MDFGSRAVGCRAASAWSERADDLLAPCDVFLRSVWLVPPSTVRPLLFSNVFIPFSLGSCSEQRGVPTRPRNVIEAPFLLPRFPSRSLLPILLFLHHPLPHHHCS